MDFSDLISEMKAHRIVFDDGLSETEMQNVETACGIQFPPDYRAILRQAMPIEKHDEFGIHDDFPNWRKNRLILLMVVESGF